MNANLAEYLVPVCADIIDFDALFVPGEDKILSPLGAKGVAELGICGVAPAIANAIWHATGIRVRDLPITPDKLAWRYAPLIQTSQNARTNAPSPVQILVHEIRRPEHCTSDNYTVLPLLMIFTSSRSREVLTL